jgi:hypothetical protein
MILDSYYSFIKIEGKKTRYDVEASTKDYEPFESLKKPTGELSLFLCDLPAHFKGEAHRRADKCLTAKGRNVSSIYIRDLVNFTGYGDVRGTTDAFIIVFSPDQQRFEVFMAKGKKNHSNALYNAFTDGELNSEMEALRLKAYRL